MGDTIFQNKPCMPDQDDATEPCEGSIQVRQVPTRSGRSGALSTYRLGSDEMHVVNVTRPRRGHDY